MWKNGKFNGEGKFYDTEAEYVGNWVNDVKHGLGNPLTTSNVAHEKSWIRFLGLPGGILLKMLL